MVFTQEKTSFYTFTQVRNINIFATAGNFSLLNCLLAVQSNCLILGSVK